MNCSGELIRVVCVFVRFFLFREFWYVVVFDCLGYDMCLAHHWIVGSHSWHSITDASDAYGLSLSIYEQIISLIMCQFRRRGCSKFPNYYNTHTSWRLRIYKLTIKYSGQTNSIRKQLNSFESNSKMRVNPALCFFAVLLNVDALKETNIHKNALRPYIVLAFHLFCGIHQNIYIIYILLFSGSSTNKSIPTHKSQHINRITVNPRRTWSLQPHSHVMQWIRMWRGLWDARRR